MTRLEVIKKLYESLHEIYGKYMGKHPSRMSVEKRMRMYIKILDEALQDYNKMSTLIWAYDWLSNPDMFDHEESLCGHHALFNRLPADECAEMKMYAELSRVAWDLDMVHAMKMPKFLSHLGKKFDIDNDQLCDLIFEKGHEYFSMQLALCMGMGMLNRHVGVNGIYQDRLAHEIHYYKGSLNSCKTQKEKAEKINKFMNLIFKMHNHEEIGKMLGLRGWQLGNYDAVEGWFYEQFNPRIVRMVKELNAWIAPLMRGENMDILPDTFEEALVMLREKMNSLAEKHEVTLYDEDLTFNYIFSNNCHLFDINLNIAD